MLVDSASSSLDEMLPVHTDSDAIEQTATSEFQNSIFKITDFVHYQYYYYGTPNEANN